MRHCRPLTVALVDLVLGVGEVDCILAQFLQCGGGGGREAQSELVATVAI
jgi:hypothetical protein